MKYLNFGFEYSKCSWVYPDCIYLIDDLKTITTDWTLKSCYPNVLVSDCKKIPNKGLKVFVNFTKNYVSSYWKWGQLLTGSQGLGIIYDKKLYTVRVDTKNLLALLQTQGVDEDGMLRGTYKLSLLGGMGCYRFVPEDTLEDNFKTNISKVYHDKTKPFTKKMKPGHLYITKTRQLMLCLGNNLDFYSKSLDPGGYYGYYTRLSDYSDTPRKIKLLFNLWDSERFDEVENAGIKTVQEFLTYKGLSDQGYIYSDDYAGKDLGPYLQDDGRSFFSSLTGRCKNLHLYSDYSFIEGLFYKDEERKNSVIEYLKSKDGERHKNETIKRNSEISKLLGRLGL